MKVFVFPGQGAQFSGMGKTLYDNYNEAKAMFQEANQIVGFDITDIMFNGTEEELKRTAITQPAIFIHSVIACKCLKNENRPQMVAGHSLGEFSALVANETLTFQDALLLVKQRADAMRQACEQNPSSMAAILGLRNEQVTEICQTIDETVVAANYNCRGQVVISGSRKGVELAAEALKNAGAKRAIMLKVGGGFHSPCMQPAQELLAKAIENTHFNTPICPIYQNCNALPVIHPNEIKHNLIQQLTSPVLWSQTIGNMVQNGADEFYEFGPGTVLQNLIKKDFPNMSAVSLQ